MSAATSAAIQATMVTLVAIVGGFLAVGFCRLVEALLQRRPLLGAAVAIAGAAAFMWIMMFWIFLSGA